METRDRSRVSVFVVTRFSILLEARTFQWWAHKKQRTLIDKLLRRPKVISEPTLQGKADYLFATERLNYRFWTFEKILLASLSRQTDTAFTHLVYSSVHLPDWAKGRLLDLGERYGFKTSFLEANDSVEGALEREAFDGAGTQVTTTSRIDDDDAVSKNFVSDIRDHADQSKIDHIITWRNGIFLTDNGNRRYTFSRKSIPFTSCGLTRVRAGAGITPSIYSAGGHSKVYKRFPVVQIRRKDAYFMTNHYDNVSGRQPFGKQLLCDDSHIEYFYDQFGVEL